MVIEEARKVIVSLMAAYPNYRPVDVNATVKVWADATEGYSYGQVSTALTAYIRADTSGFAPVPGQVIEKIQMMTQPEMLNEMEAWALVSEALRNGAYNSAEEFAKLPPLVQKAVGVPDQLRIWAMDEDYNETVVSSNFIKCYRTVAQRQKEIDRMPESVRRLIENASKGSYAVKIEQKRKRAESASERKQGKTEALESVTDVCEMPDRLRDKYNSIMEEMRGNTNL